jgi:hypothetical protein
MQLFKKRLKGIGIAMLISIVLMIILYIIMLIDTNSVFNYAKDVFLGKVPHDEVAGTPLSIYDITKWEENARATVKISRVVVFHNFSDGYIIVKYVHRGYDESGKRRFLTAAEFPYWDKWIIHKENGEWKIVKVYQPDRGMTIFDV